MNLQEYMYDLNKMIEKDPSILQLNVISASDDEGNSYLDVGYSPSLGNFNLHENSFQPREEDLEVEINAICIN